MPPTIMTCKACGGHRRPDRPYCWRCERVREYHRWLMKKYYQAGLMGEEVMNAKGWLMYEFSDMPPTIMTANGKTLIWCYGKNPGWCPIDEI